MGRGSLEALKHTTSTTMSKGFLQGLFKQRNEAPRDRDTPADYACPDCGSQDDLSVMFIVKARLRRVDGVDRPDAPDMTRWTDGNGMCCGDCGWKGAASSARVDRLIDAA